MRLGGSGEVKVRASWQVCLKDDSAVQDCDDEPRLRILEESEHEARGLAG